MDRALREFRIRGVKTNIPFLENLILASDVPARGEATTTLIDYTPELFRFRPSRDRATKMLSYLGDVIVNGRPDVKGKIRSEGRIYRASFPISGSSRPPPGSRQQAAGVGAGKVRQ